MSKHNMYDYLPIILITAASIFVAGVLISGARGSRNNDQVRGGVLNGSRRLPLVGKCGPLARDYSDCGCGM